MSSKQIGIGLYEFLIESELQHYYNSIKNDLKVLSVCQLKYVTDEDLVQIGMSRPEIRRLKKFFLKHCPQTYLAKIKKKLLNRRDDAISVAALSSYAQNVPGRPVRNVAPGRHIIQADSIVIHKTLGSGEFGTVQQGVWTSEDGQRTQVAIKCLSQERMENNPVEFLKEAAIMHNVDHEHVVRLYGVVLDTSALMLVTELAPLRSLLECLKEPSMRPNLSVPTLYDFAVQICDGMQYLESKRLIHRDLAARNILVFSRTKVKISDFGLSRALGVGKDYYQTNFNVNLKLPIAWCAPECINFLRFTTASDVWAYGVALWEMFSYGFQPWAALTGQQILEAIDEPNYQRLERPECCPNEIYYQIMLKCWQHDPQSRPTFTQLSNLILESKPEMVQAIRESDARPRRDFLVYDAGDVITVLDRKPSQNTDDVILWKGALKDGKTGLFHPASTITYIGSSLPSVKNSQGSFHRNDSRSSSMRKGRISADMISGPQGDLKHTGHVGPDGQFFGDLTFLGSKCWVPRQVVSPYKPESPTSFDASGSTPSLPGPQCSSRSVKESTSDMSSSDTVPLLETASSMNTDDVGNRSSSSTGVLRRRHHMALSTVGNNFGEQDHEYHEISDEENDNIGAGISGCYHQCSVGLSNPALSSRSQSPLDSPRFEKNFDLEVGPSLIDEVFSALQHDCHSQPDEAHNVKNELREMARAKKKFASVKPISSSDRRTLDHAIAIANELASRSMLDLDRSGKHRNSSMDDISSPQTPNSPSHRRKFSFILGGKNDRERRNYSQEAASIPDIQSTLTEEAKEAYNSLVEKPSNTLEFLTPSYDSRTTFVFPENNNSETRSSTSNVFDTEATSSAAGPQSLTESFINLKSSASANVNITSFPGKNHARSLSKSDADEEPVCSLRTLSTNDDDEVDGNPLRLLRQNKQAMLTNVLPLPPRKGATSQSAQTTRHQRKHPLLIPNRVNSSIPRQGLQTAAAREAPTPPPKPARHAILTTMTGETGDKPEESKTNLTSCLNNELEKKLNANKVVSENIERDMIKFPDCPDNTTVGMTNLGVPPETSRRSEESISLYENIVDPAADSARVTDTNGNEADDHREIMPEGQEPPQPATCTISSAHDTSQKNEGLSRVQSFNPKPQESSPAPKPFQDSSNNNIKIKPESSPYTIQVAQPFRIAPGSSIKIKTLQRILGPSATEKDCCWALEATDMDSAHAVKLLRLKALLPESLISEDVAHVVSVLEMSHWDVARSAAFLLNNSNGSTSKTVPSRSKLTGLTDLSTSDQSSPADSISSVDVAVTSRKSFQPDSPAHPYIRPTQV